MATGGFPHERLDAYGAGLDLIRCARIVEAGCPGDLDWLGADLLRSASAVPLEVAAGASEWRPGPARRRFRQACAAAARCGAAADVAAALGIEVAAVDELRVAAGAAVEACGRLVR